MKEKPNTPLHEMLISVTSLAVHSLDSAVQKKFVNIALVIRNRRKRSLNLGNEIQPCYILGEIDEIIGDWWTSLRGDSHGLKRAQEHPLWISINEFCARLTKAEVCDWTHGATILCNELLDNPNLRENRILSALALSAAAQHMIHAALNVYTYFEKSRTSWGLSYRWEEWKAVLKAAETVKFVKARNDALSAVVAMDAAERLHKMKGEEANDYAWNVETVGTKWGS